MVREKDFYKTLAMLSLPIAAQNVLTYLVGLADNLMLSLLGEEAVSGAFVANQIMTLLQMYVAGVSAALTVLAAQYWGKRDTKSIGSITGVAFRFAVIAGALLFLFTSIFPQIAIGLFTNDAAAAAAGAAYIRIVSFSFIPFCVTGVLIAALRSVEIVRIGASSAFASLLVNVALNWILIFGKCGAPRLGVRGAAWATLIARYCALLIVLFYCLRRRDPLRLKARTLVTPGSPFLRDFVRYGLPILAGEVLWGMNIASQGAIVGRLGTASISAVSIANTIFSLVTVGMYGLRDASSVVIGKTVGAGDIPRVKRYTYTLQAIYVLLGLLTGIGIFLSQFLLQTIYSGMQAQTLLVARQLLRVLSVTVVGTSYEMSTLTGIVRAGGATRFVFCNDMIFVWLVVIPSALLAAFVFRAPTWIVFACLKCDQILKCTVAAVKVNRFRWIRNLTTEHA